MGFTDFSEFTIEVPKTFSNLRDPQQDSLAFYVYELHGWEK